MFKKGDRVEFRPSLGGRTGQRRGTVDEDSNEKDGRTYVIYDRADEDHRSYTETRCLHKVEETPAPFAHLAKNPEATLREHTGHKNMLLFLNSLLEIDNEAIQTLFSTRAICNKELAEHPTVQVGQTVGETTISILGILNGFYGTLDAPDEPYHMHGPITALMDNGKVVKFLPTVDMWNGKTGQGYD